MRIFSLVSLFTLGLYYAGFAQVDIVNARANPKTFIFDDDKHTVHGYIYGELKAKTACCGNDAIYLEVKFDQTGTTTLVKPLTGKNTCYQQSIADIVKNVKWDATGVTGTKAIYFEVKPIVPCSGSPGENVYKAVPSVGGGVVATVPTPDKSNEVAVVEVKQPDPKTTVVKEDVAVTVPEKQPVKEDEGFLSDESGSNESSESKEPVAEPVKPTKADLKQPTPPVAVVSTPAPAPAPTNPPKKLGTQKLPPQANIDYVSRGDLAPDESHRETHVNMNPNQPGQPRISDQSQFGVQVRQSLRNAGFCGLAQALMEVEVDRNGNVLSSRVMYANNDKVKEILPNIVRSMKFEPLGSAPRSVFSYYQVKTEIVCGGGKPQHNLDQVPNILKTPAGAQP